MVRRLCVIRTNCEPIAISWISWLKRPMLASSSGASTSSSRQNGVGRALQVGALANQELVPAAQLLEFGQRGGAHVTETREARAQRLHPRRPFVVLPIVGRWHVRQRLRAEAVALGELRGQVLERKT